MLPLGRSYRKSIERLSLSVSYFDMDPSRLDDYGLIDYELFISMIPEYESLIKNRKALEVFL